MNRKTILKDVSENVRNNFWSYFTAILILSVAGLICNGGFATLFQSQRILHAIRAGFFSIEQMSDFKSDFWSVVGNAPGLGFIGMIGLYFLVNPLSVNVNKFFLKGLSDNPELKLLAERDNYRNNVFVTFFSGLLFEIIIFAMFLAYFLITSLFLVKIEGIAGLILGLIITVFLAVKLIGVRYNFSFVKYILTENKGWGFGLIYLLSRKLVNKRKWKIFKLEFWYLIIKSVCVMLPVTLFMSGIIAEAYGFSGEGFATASIIIIVPMYCLYTFISIYKNALWAKLYSEFREELPLKESNVSEYAMPDNEENISYE